MVREGVKLYLFLDNLIMQIDNSKEYSHQNKCLVRSIYNNQLYFYRLAGNSWKQKQKKKEKHTHTTNNIIRFEYC